MGSVPAPCCGFRHGNVLFMPEARKKNSATTGSQLRRGGEEVGTTSSLEQVVVVVGFIYSDVGSSHTRVSVSP